MKRALAATGALCALASLGCGAAAIWVQQMPLRGELAGTAFLALCVSCVAFYVFAFWETP